MFRTRSKLRACVKQAHACHHSMCCAVLRSELHMRQPLHCSSHLVAHDCCCQSHAAATLASGVDSTGCHLGHVLQQLGLGNSCGFGWLIGCDSVLRCGGGVQEASAAQQGREM